MYPSNDRFEYGGGVNRRGEPQVSRLPFKGCIHCGCDHWCEACESKDETWEAINAGCSDRTA
jgi:hypothetical protein